MPQIHNVNIQHIDPLASPKEYLKQFPSTSQISQLVAGGREQISRILRGEDNRMLLITGPCSLHDVQAGYEYAQRLKRLADELQDRLLVVMRVYFEKPRTTVGWKGLIYDPHLNGSCDINSGLQMAREFLLQVSNLGLLTAIEFVDPITPQYISDLVAWAAIGARTSESQTHRQMASGLSMPVGFKNGTGGSIQLAVDGVVAARAVHAFLGVDANGTASTVITKGNSDCHIVLRGGSQGPNYDTNSIVDAMDRLELAGLGRQLVVDCSHANCGKDYTKQSVAFRDVLGQRLLGNNDIAGVMLESHLQASSQKLDEANPTQLQYGVSITDPCVGWEETVELLTEAYDLLGTTQRVSTTA